MERPLVSVAVPTYNRSAMLKNTLDGLLAQETDGIFAYEVLVLDDASTDDTPDVVAALSREATVPVRYILAEGKGYTHVLNRAVTEFTGQWLAFFDDDQLAGPGWLKALFTVAREQEAGMVGGPVVLDIPEAVLAGLGPVCRDLYGESPDVREPERYRTTPPLPSGGNRLVHRRVFEQVGTFDETMLTGGCDRDFLLRACAAGVVMGWAPEAVARHVISADRFSAAHMRSYSLQWGCSFAHIDRKRWGMTRTTLACIARIGQAVLVNLPCALAARIRGDRRALRDREVLLWRAQGYVRKTMQMLLPSLFAQEKFFAGVEFRRVRPEVP
ncbi:MAG TPA: glycosyltransferase [Desulfobulbus sp.]|nr:glycosyltransferase [Desulfobulbus sp.]